MEKKWFTRAEAAIYLERSEKEVKKLSVNGWIKTYKIFNLNRFEKQSLDYFLKYHKERGP